MIGISTNPKLEDPNAAIAETVPGYRSSAPTPAAPKKWNSWTDSGTDLLVGTMMGDFRIDEVIASGGMGTVYKATQLQPIHRVVALKMIRVGSVSESTLRRFQRERQALAHLNHPDIAHIFEADTTRDGQPYFVMEYCDGQSIDEFCDERCLSIEDRLKLILRLTNAISEAHREGIIHRDLKPSNIIVADGDDQTIIRVIDFGIAKLTDENSSDGSAGITEIGEFVGTPAYMAPEQALGSNVDARADVFGIGAVLFKLITGTTPLKIPDDSQPSFMRLIEDIRNLDCDTPSHRLATAAKEERSDRALSLGFSSSHLLIASLRRELDWIVLKALEGNRTRRYATAEDFSADLKAFLEHRPITAVAPDWMYRARKLYERRKAVVLASAVSSVAVLLAVTVAGFSWWEIRNEQQAEMRILETEAHVLLRLAEHTRERAIKSGSTSEFDDAEETLEQVRVLIREKPELSDFREQLSKATAAVKTARDRCVRSSELNRPTAR